MTEIGYTATKRDLLRDTNALVGNDIYHWFDSTRGWKRIGAFAPDFIEQRVDSNGLIQGIMDPTVPLLDDHVMNATINLNIITTDDKTVINAYKKGDIKIIYRCISISSGEYPNFS